MKNKLNTKTVVKLNVIDQVNMSLAELNCELSYSELAEWRMNNYIVSFDELIIRIWCHRENMEQKRISKEQISFALANIESTKKEQIFMSFKDLITYSPDAPDTFDTLAKLISVEHYDPMYPIVLKHVVWTVKRRLFELKDYCPIFLNVFGSAGIGKSELLRAMFSIFPSSMKSSVNNASELFNDDRQTFRFAQHYIIIMDELTGLNRADLNKLKNQIDSLIVIYRMLGYNKTASGRNNAQLIGTSNTRLANTLITDRDVRKWAELDMFAYPDAEVPAKMVKPLIDFDWLTLWRSVDERGLSPFHDPAIYSAFKQWTAAKCEAETPTSIYIRDLIEQRHGQIVSLPDLYEDYTLTITEKHLGRSNFKEKIEKYGFVHTRTTSKRGYLIPDTLTDDTNFVEDKPQQTTREKLIAHYENNNN